MESQKTRSYQSALNQKADEIFKREGSIFERDHSKHINKARAFLLQSKEIFEEDKYGIFFEKYKSNAALFEKCFGEPSSVYDYLKSKYRAGFGEIYDAVNDETLPLSLREHLLYIEQIKADEIISFFKNNYTSKGKRHILDLEQAKAISASQKHVIVSARAGSGKTRVIASKVLYLIDHEKVPESSILALAFNKNVPEEINKRINCQIVRRGQNESERTLNIARTFHSLAYRCSDEQEVLSDKEGNNRKKFIKLIIEELKDKMPGFRDRVYEYFRKESFEIDRIQFANEDRYYEYMRNCTYTTLNGEHVKSLGEKWIADYLFEHGIQYIYEQTFYPQYIKEDVFDGKDEDRKRCQAFLNENSEIMGNGKTRRKVVKPDFFLCGYQLVWEHWGIDENETRDETKNEFSNIADMSWEDYHLRMQWKRKFWQPKWRNKLRPIKYVKEIVSIESLIETSITDMRNGAGMFERCVFEHRLSAILDENGIKCEKRSHEELVQLVWNRQIPRFVELMVSFIDKFEQQRANQSIAEFETEFELSYVSERSAEFVRLGLDVFKRYLELLPMKNKPEPFTEFSRYTCDFNQLIAKATQAIVSGEQDDTLMPVRYLLIDEYQDFSELFYQFIRAIIERNNNINLFCVGDTWQAINRFMGADTKYFDNFTSLFPNATEKCISTNYRTASKLVDISNRFMKLNGFPGTIAKAHNSVSGSMIIQNVEDIWLENREGQPRYESDQKYHTLLSKNNKNLIVSRYIKRCIEIIEENRGKSILLLDRKNAFKSDYKLDEVQHKIRSFLKRELGFSDEDYLKVKVKTIHSAKGDESDVVILLEANWRSIPLIHPDNELFAVFGERPNEVMMDERRLFYVAITRAKEKLYILHDGQPSDFVKQLAIL